MYKQILDNLSKEIKSVQRLADNAFIPFDPANTDAQQFAKWLQDGNKPDPAEEGGTVTDEWIEETLKKFGYNDGVGG
jgi:cytochrome oxidase Cu insertion factor (SCO1/SenC/PrrC family)